MTSSLLTVGFLAHRLSRTLYTTIQAISSLATRIKVLTGRIVIVLSHILPHVQPGIANIANRGVARPPVSNC